jgi:hypothetical protein
MSQQLPSGSLPCSYPVSSSISLSDCSALVPPIEVAPRIACAHHSIVAALAALVFELRPRGDGVERLAAADIFS